MLLCYFWSSSSSGLRVSTAATSVNSVNNLLRSTLPINLFPQFPVSTLRYLLFREIIMASDLSDSEIQLLYQSSGVTRSLKRRRFSPTAGGGHDLEVGSVQDRRVTRRYLSRINQPLLSVSVQLEPIIRMTDQQLSPGQYRDPVSHVVTEDSGEESPSSMPGLASSIDLDTSSDESTFEDLKLGKPVLDNDIKTISDSSSTRSSTESSSEDSQGDDGPDEDEDGDEDANVTIKDNQGGNNNLNGKSLILIILFPVCLFPISVSSLTSNIADSIVYLESVVAAPSMIMLNNSNPLGCGQVPYADNTIQAGEEMEEEIHENNEPAVAEVPAVLPSVSNLISTEAAVNALIQTDSVAAAVRLAIEKIKARQRQEKENQEDIDFWNSVSAFSTSVCSRNKTCLFPRSVHHIARKYP